MKLVCPRNKTVSIRNQCTLLNISRRPTEGVMSMVYYLRDLGYPIGPKRIRRLFKIMGRETLYRKKNLSKLGLKEYIKPYLLRNLVVDRPNQVWCTDLTYIPMAKGFMYLTAFIDVFSRKIMSWGISNSMDASWCLQVLQEGIDRYGKPEIVNSDQGSQYTSAIWTQYLEKQEIKISMDGKGRATDNAWIERFWKSIKNDHIYLNPANDGFELIEGVQNHIAYYNAKTHHTTKQKPNDRYEQNLIKSAA